MRASYVLYGAQYIDPVSLSRFYLQAGDSHIDLIRASYVVYGVNYIDLVTPAPFLGQEYTELRQPSKRWKTDHRPDDRHNKPVTHTLT